METIILDIFSCIKSGIFPIKWKMANVVPIHKRNDKQNVKNYGLVSLLPIFRKIFERLIYNEMYSFFVENGSISPNQSGFKQGYSCINQLFTIMHNIYQSLDQGYEVRGVFLDISKVSIRPGVMFLPVFRKDLFLASFCFLFISIIYLMVFSVTQNCFRRFLIICNSAS